MLYIPTLEWSRLETAIIRARWNHEDQIREANRLKHQADSDFRFRVFMALKSFGIALPYDTQRLDQFLETSI